jgi:hypothetical protein
MYLMNEMPKEINQYQEWKRCRRELVLFSIALTFFVGAQFLLFWQNHHKSPKTSALTGLTAGTTTIVDSGVLVSSQPKPLLTNADLQKMYDEMDARYFDGQLPKIPISFEPTTSNLLGFYSRKKVVIVVTDRDEYDVSDCRDTLLHEMAHYYVELEFPGSPETELSSYGHGVHWKAEMRHLAAMGALDYKLFNDEERP